VGKPLEDKGSFQSELIILKTTIPVAAEFGTTELSSLALLGRNSSSEILVCYQDRLQFVYGIYLYSFVNTGV
jgi:hypothetical protein